MGVSPVRGPPMIISFKRSTGVGARPGPIVGPDRTPAGCVDSNTKPGEGAGVDPDCSNTKPRGGVGVNESEPIGPNWPPSNTTRSPVFASSACNFPTSLRFAPRVRSAPISVERLLCPTGEAPQHRRLPNRQGFHDAALQFSWRAAQSRQVLSDLAPPVLVVLSKTPLLNLRVVRTGQGSRPSGGRFGRQRVSL